MELILNAGDSVKIPENCTVIERDGMVFFEPLKYIPKVGDCVEAGRSSSNGVVYFEVESKSDGRLFYKSRIIFGKVKSESSWHIGNNSTFKQITPEQLQTKFKELGYEYNFDTHTARKLKWRPKKGEDYLFISTIFDVLQTTNNDPAIDNLRFKAGNCFKLSDRKSAEKFLSYIKAYKHE